MIHDELGGTMDDASDLDKHRNSDRLQSDVAHDSSLEDLQKSKKKRKRVGAEKVFSTRKEEK